MNRTIGSSGIEVTPVAMGCWPIAGMTSIDVNDADSLATLRAAFDAGINFFDTAYCYGAAGESEKLIATALGSCRSEIVIATKAGIHWDEDIQCVIIDGRPEKILEEVDESLAAVWKPTTSNCCIITRPIRMFRLLIQRGRFVRFWIRAKRWRLVCPTIRWSKWMSLRPSVRSKRCSRPTTCCSGISRVIFCRTAWKRTFR